MDKSLRDILEESTDLFDDSEVLDRVYIENEDPPFVVIFVDDVQTNLDQYQLLEEDHWDAHYFLRTEDAKKFLSENEVQVVVSDQKMPEENGVSFLKHVKESYPHIFRLLITGFSEEALVIASIKEAKVHDYFKKPYDPDDLTKKINNLCIRSFEDSFPRNVYV